MLTQRRLGRKGWRKTAPSNYLHKQPDLTGELADMDKKKSHRQDRWYLRQPQDAALLIPELKTNNL